MTTITKNFRRLAHALLALSLIGLPSGLAQETTPTSHSTASSHPQEQLSSGEQARDTSKYNLGKNTPYVVNRKDNICGLDEPRQISRPAKVDYQALLDMTPEVKKLKRKKIDPSSAKGADLMSKARRRVLTACATVRRANSYCSVWKKISLRERKKGTKPVDITSDVKKEMAKG